MKVKIIAEIGCNHKGDIDIAKKMIKIASINCGADVIKFQKRDNKFLLPPKQYNSPHPNPDNSYGDTYGEHRDYLEFTVEQHKILKNYCEELGSEYSTSVWEVNSAKEIAMLKPNLIKIPSATNQNYDLLNYLCDNYNNEIHISLGMTSRLEEEKLIKFLDDKDKLKNVILYSCTSGYPVDYENICLLEIKRLKKTYGSKVKAIGFSGHHLGIAVDIAAVTLGANWVERHYTLDRTWKGTDHSASLEPQELKRLIKDIRNTEKALSYKKTEILPLEEPHRKKLKWQR